MLRDATGLAAGDVGLADRVEQGRLAVVDVAEDAHHGRSRREIDGFVDGRLLLLRLLLLLRGVLGGDVTAVLHLEREAMLLGDPGGDLLVETLRHRGEDPHLHQLGDQLERLEPEGRGEVAHEHRGLHVNGLDVALLGERRHRHGRDGGRGQREWTGTRRTRRGER